MKQVYGGWIGLLLPRPYCRNFILDDKDTYVELFRKMKNDIASCI